MNNHIIESIGSWGVVTTPIRMRIDRVRPGDIIEVPESFRTYPMAHAHSRIATIKDGIAHVCEGMGSAYLNKDGSCDISGGPWWSVPISTLQPKHELHEATYWNWGNNYAGASQGVYYQICRPVHCLTIHVNDFKYRYAKDESGARKGKYAHEEALKESEWTLLRKSIEDSDGEYQWTFQKTRNDPAANVA